MKRSMMQVYIKNSAQALDFYADALGAYLVCKHFNVDGTVAHAELDVYGQILAICETLEPEAATGNTMQFCLHFGDGTEALVRDVIDKLSEGGNMQFYGPTDWSLLMADIVDRFGIRWCVFA